MTTPREPMNVKWQAVEVGADEWFLGKPDGEGGYSPFYDLGSVPGDVARKIAALLSAAEEFDDEDLPR